MRVPPDQSWTARETLRERRVHVAVAQLPGDVGEPRAEGERADAVAVPCHRVEEMQEHARIAAHRARYIGERNQRGRAPLERAAAQRNGGAPALQACAQAGARIDARAARIRRVAAGRQFRQPQAQSLDGCACRRQLLVRHALEVERAQRLAGGKGNARVEFDPFRRWSGRGCVALRRQRLGEPRGKLRLAVVSRNTPAYFREVPHARGVVRIAPEHPERLIVEVELVAAAEEYRRERPVEIVAPLDACELEGAECVDHAVGTDGQSGSAQQAREVHDVFRKFSRLWLK